MFREIVDRRKQKDVSPGDSPRSRCGRRVQEINLSPFLGWACRCVRARRKADGSYIYGTHLKYLPLMGINRPKG